MHDANHPLWGFLKFLAVIGAVTLVLWKNASNFDATEYRAIAEVAAAILAGKGAVAIKEQFDKKQTETVQRRDEETA